MECNKVDNLLSAYIDRELLTPDMNRIKEHLEKCQKCKLEYQSLLRIKNRLADLEEKELPPYFISKLIAKIQDEEKFPLRYKILRLLSQRYAVIPTVAGALIIFLLILLSIFNSFFIRPNDTLATHFYIKEHTRYAINQPLSESVSLAFANTEANVVLVSDEEWGE